MDFVWWTSKIIAEKIFRTADIKSKKEKIEDFRKVWLAKFENQQVLDKLIQEIFPKSSSVRIEVKKK